MEIRFFRDPETEQPHIFDHNVQEAEVVDVLHNSLEDRAGPDDTRVCVGQTAAGRYLRVIYSRDELADDIFVITAYDLPVKQLKALRRRLRRRPR